MKIKEIQKVIEDFSGVELSIVSNKHDVAFLKKAFIVLCYKYSTDYITQDKINDIIKYRSRGMISVNLNGFSDVIKFNPEYSKNFKVLNDEIRKTTKERCIYNEDLNIPILVLTNRFNELRRKYKIMSLQRDRLLKSTVS